MRIQCRGKIGLGGRYFTCSRWALPDSDYCEVHKQKHIKLLGKKEKVYKLWAVIYKGKLFYANSGRGFIYRDRKKANENCINPGERVVPVEVRVRG